MKKLVLLLGILTIMGCKEEPKNYVTFSGKITNKNTDSIILRTRTYNKTIQLNDDGTFKDTLKIPETGVFAFYDGKESMPIFLKNGFDLELQVDASEFDETVKFTGKGAEHNNFLASQKLLEEELLDQDKLSTLSSDELKREIADIRAKLTSSIEKDASVDTLLTAMAKRNLEPMLNTYEMYFLETIAVREQFPVGSPSPTFKNYDNYAGGTTSLEDLKGKYVYIDVWATWCGPCLMEIPSLKKLEAEYADKNIQFVSISLDDAYRTGGGDPAVAKNKWRAMIKDKELAGIQLFSDKNWESEFVKNYKIDGIPRFILIDPNGNVVDANAPRPSSKKLTELFDSLEI